MNKSEHFGISVFFLNICSHLENSCISNLYSNSKVCMIKLLIDLLSFDVNPKELSIYIFFFLLGLPLLQEGIEELD
jgi:hypothetical protein